LWAYALTSVKWDQEEWNASPPEERAYLQKTYQAEEENRK